MTPFFEAIKRRVEEDKLFLIAYCGASLTSFEYMFPNWGEILRYVLKEELEKKVKDWGKAYWNLQTVNMGLDGANTVDLLKRLDEFILDKNPQMVFLKDVGGNDAHTGISKGDTESNTKKIIDLILAKDIKVVFLTTIPPARDDLNKSAAGYVEIDKKVADRFSGNNNFVFADLFTNFPADLIKKSYSLISEESEPLDIKEGDIDPIHYNRYGNAVVAKILLKQVFGIEFDHEKFLKDVADDTVKYPSY